MKRCAKSLMIVSLNACRSGDCVDKVNGYTCDCDEDHELMLHVNGSACVARNVKNFFLQRVQIEGVRCDTVPAESAEIHDTCIRPRECVCGSTFNNGRTRAHVIKTAPASVQSSSQRVGALSLIPSCLGISGHPSGPGKDTHGTLGPDQREGRGWPEHSSAQQYSAETPQTKKVIFFDFFFNEFFLEKKVSPPKRLKKGFLSRSIEFSSHASHVRSRLNLVSFSCVVR